MTVVFATQARIDMEELHAHIARHSPSSASLTLARIRKAINRLEMFPHSGRPGYVEGTRELIVAQRTYRVVYQIVRDQVVIERILHSSRLSRPVAQSDPAHLEEMLLDRVATSFAVEARGLGDVAAQLFGRAAERGVRLLQLLDRQYAVVATNPHPVPSGDGFGRP